MKGTGAIIAAAGLSSRMGDFKPLLPFGDLSIAEHMVEMLKHAGISPIVMVVGYRGRELKRRLAFTGVHFVVNERYESTQMMDSVKLGLSEIKDCCDQVLVMPVDVPAIMEETVCLVANTDGIIVRPRCEGKYGHPVKLDRNMIKQVLEYRGEDGLRGFIKCNLAYVTALDVSDQGIFLDADTREEYQKLLALNGFMGRGYPDLDACRRLMDAYQMPEPVMRHVEAVSRKALEMADTLCRVGICLDRGLIESAALLHDIARGEPDHANRGAEIVRRSGYAQAAEIIRQHHDLDEVPRNVDETLVVYLADKMIQGEKETSLQERFEKSAVKCQNNRKAWENHERRYRQALMAWKVWAQSAQALQL